VKGYRKNDLMRCEVKKHTTVEDAWDAINSTMYSGFHAKAPLKQIYMWMHSPIRTQIFSIQLYDIYSFVSVHLSRHVTTVPFVQSKRIDRDGNGTEDRYTLVNHRILCNAEAIMNMANKRLCYKASPETRDVMIMIKNEIERVDPDLSYYMVPQCVYRGGICPEPRPCGNYKVRRFKGIEDERNMRIILDKPE
jgi:hypothetical protein